MCEVARIAVRLKAKPMSLGRAGCAPGARRSRGTNFVVVRLVSHRCSHIRSESMIAKSRLESNALCDRGESTKLPSGAPANDDVRPSLRDLGRRPASRRVTGSAGAQRIANLSSDLGPCSFGPAVAQRLPSHDRSEAAARVLRAAECNDPRTNIRDQERVGREPLHEFAAASGDDVGPPLIFVLMTPRRVRDDRVAEVSFPSSASAAVANARETMDASARDGHASVAIQFYDVSTEILAGIGRVLLEPDAGWRPSVAPEVPRARLSNLSRRERDVLQRVLAGHPNKNIAADLHISQRTVENHRAKVMRKTGCRSLPALVSLAIAAGEMPAAASMALR